ncbi:MAG TPA: hypothetical protein VH643_12025 [Gemmataceae bacterium]|jgi:hypothetical protein
MKVKLFVQDKGVVESLEEQVNTWLAANAGIRIRHITQSSNGGSLERTSKVFISVWYEEGDDPSIAHASG